MDYNLLNQNNQLKQFRKELRIESRNLFNRLKSIQKDSTFVDATIASLKRRNDCLLYANERCIIVDSTRNGKRMPDSFSKTIPIWIAVVNNAFLDIISKNENNSLTDTKRQELLEIWNAQLHTNLAYVSQLESDMILKFIPKFTEQLLKSSIPLKDMVLQLKKPLRPIWITHETNVLEFESIDYSVLDFLPVILLNPSKVKKDGKFDEGFSYIQGSGDDHEHWGQGLVPEIFWNYYGKIMAINSNEELNKVILELVSQWPVRDKILGKEQIPELQKRYQQSFHFIGDTHFAIGNRFSGNPIFCFETFDFVINCGAEEYSEFKDSPEKFKDVYLFIPLQEGKRGTHSLKIFLPIVFEFVQRQNSEKKGLIHCMQGEYKTIKFFIKVHLVRSGSIRFGTQLDLKI
ncbi:hypothetical protein HDU92_002255 [Lobulomyces angularis]|nr:hypothetical protein HDU92_002255 [Lobulomyces angularis]